jgi:hypothetical protein
MNDYIALILIGHPYSSQLFAGSLFILSLHFLRKEIIKNLLPGSNFTPAIFWMLSSALFFFAGIWVSEFNTVLILIPVLFIFMDEGLRKTIISGRKNVRHILFVVFSAIIYVAAICAYKYIKSFAWQDDSYDKMFINNIGDILKNSKYFLDQFLNTLLYRDKLILSDTFNWFLIIVSVVLFIKRRATNKKSVRGNVFDKSLLIVCLVSCAMLFFSTWNLRSAFCPRYFTPVYVLFCFYLFRRSDKLSSERIVHTISIVFIFFCVIYCLANEAFVKERPLFKKYNEFKNLPKGTLIGEYWDTYKINSVAIENLESLPFDDQFVRNWEWKDKLLNETNFYFIEDPSSKELKDLVIQFGIFFKYSGTTYVCNGIRVKLYHKFFDQQTPRFAIKASNNKYISIQPDYHVTADQTEKSKAEVFELVLLKSGQVAFRTTKGKYLCSNPSVGDEIFANSDNPWNWETFYIYPTGKAKVNIKSLNGKFVSSDMAKENRLIANRLEAKEWEEFIFEPRK